MTETASLAPAKRRTAAILSGGGARGAYEVGVLSYLYDEFTRRRNRPPRFDILSGTSIGAINACFLTAHMADPVLGMRRLVELWTELEISKVLGFGIRQIAMLPRLVSGGGQETGLFDARPMKELVEKEISWRAVSRSLRQRHLRALSVSCTEVSTGRTVVFMQTSPDVVIPETAPPRTLFRADRIGPHHALASAAIPFLFPAVKVDNGLYLDGGLRQNTPIAPALRLGATHVFAIGSSREVRGVLVDEAGTGGVKSPSAAFLAGKVLNAFLIDHIETDLELLRRVNDVLLDGTRTYGPGFTSSLNAAASAAGRPDYRYVNCLTVRPSEDIGKLASDHIRRGRLAGDPVVARRFFKLLDLGVDTESDLASYLLFDGNFCRRIIDLGRADAHARRDELSAFFGETDEPEDGEPPLDDYGVGARASLFPSF